VQLRMAISQLLLYSPDETTLAERASEWAARLLGGAGALIALDGRVLAASGIAASAVGQLHVDIEGITDSPGLAFNSSLGTIAVAPIHSEAGAGYLAVLGGPFTPLFGDEELARLSQYAVSITVALDRVHLVGGVRRNAELLDLAHDAIFSWDFVSRQNQYWNKAASELYGFSATEALGSDAQDLLHTQYPVPVASILSHLLENDHWEGELVQRTKDGRTLPISARWALRRDANGAPVTVLEINRDISNENRVADELRRARDAAELASNAKSQYLSRMSHELRTPLAAMLGFSDLLEMREPREDQMVAIDAIQRAGAHLLGMVNDVLDIARIEAGRESLSLQPVEVSSVLEECVGLVGQSAAARRVTITTRLDGAGDIYVRADRQRLVQVLLNLLSNAIKYGAESGHIIVGAAARDGFVDIDVIDDGPGLEEGHAARLFQPFERLGAERGHIQGTGLGLALSRQLAVAMGGSLEAHSVRGEGAAFTVRLQQATGTDMPLVVPARAHSVLADTVAEHTVLVVEDNLATIALVESVFALRPTIRLLTAMQGSIAVELAREHLPALIILDLHLPDLDGAEVIGRLRGDPRTAAIPVVMYSADATDREVQRLLAAGAVAYLTKPAKVTEFLAMIDGILGKAATSPTRS
jgi:PAS domain S-box-containing protein